MRGQRIEFTGSMTRREILLSLLYLPVHLVLLPMGLAFLYALGYISLTAANVLSYAVGLVYMVLTQFRFLRREFDALCDRFAYVLVTVVTSYGGILCLNTLFGMLMQWLGLGLNPNNVAVGDAYEIGGGSIAAMTVFMAPIVEELMFRGGLFTLFRRRSRALAYVMSSAAFCFYHVFSYLSEDPRYIVFALQYLPASILLARCYEKTDSIWSSILLHMTVNGVSLLLLDMI